MTTTLADDRRTRLRRRVRWIVGFTITYNVIEAIVAIWAGTVASSAALIGFGLDSVVEVMSAAAVAWQFTRKDPERWEAVTVKVIAIAFFALAAYVTIDAVLSLAGVGEVEQSPVGIASAALSVVRKIMIAMIHTIARRPCRSSSSGCTAARPIMPRPWGRATGRRPAP